MPFFNHQPPKPRVQEPRPLSRQVVDEAEIISLDERVYRFRQAGQMAMADRLIDLRNAIRPPAPAPVPVIPGGPS